MNKKEIKEIEEILAIAREKGKTIQDLESYIMVKEKEHKKKMLVLYLVLEYWRKHDR